MTPPTLRTERFVLRALSVADAAALHPMYHDAAAMRYWHAAPHVDEAETRASLLPLLNDEACSWAICPADGGAPIGVISYLDTTVPRPGMGYFLHPAYWRQGVMTEAVRAALAYGFAVLGLDRVELWIHQGNVASQRLAQKLGFTRRGQFHRSDADGAHDTYVYGLYRYEWDGSAPKLAAPRFDVVHPVLSVPDVKAAMDFYCDRLGFTVEWAGDDPPQYAILARWEWMATGVSIHLSHRPGVQASDAVVLSIEVGSDIGALFADYVAKGITIIEPLVERPWGSREFEIADLNGYHLRFTAP